ncbi:MAG: CehA/McbA family metallohydrolase [Deltaproteobacteria bacterium]|nr:CehA/McbA family metallohydrolase [Deltaproteobacteria bacterium]
MPYLADRVRLGLGTLLCLAALGGCRPDGAPAGSETSPLLIGGPPDTPFTLRQTSSAVGGPLAQGRTGDQLLSSDSVRLVIQQPGKYPGVGSFGGNLIDADLNRSNAPGQDQFGVLLPMVNVEWTVNGIELFAVKEFDPATFTPDGLRAQRITQHPSATEPQILISRGIIDVYDYLDVDFLEPVAKALTQQTLFFSPRFDDMTSPFRVYDLKDLSTEVITAYRLDPGSRAVTITTTLFNNGDAPVPVPVGDFLNGSGEVQLLIPGLGFSPPLTEQIASDTPAIIYAAMPGVGVSYGYFYDPREFADAGAHAQTTSLSYGGVTGVLLGEEFTKLFPIGGGRTPTIRFAVPPKGRRTFTRYFVVGDGSAGSVLDEGLTRLRIPTQPVSGRVVDAGGAPVPGATVAILSEKGRTIITYRTDGDGRFHGFLSTGADPHAVAFGNGRYTVRVDQAGYHVAGTDRAGNCAPESIDLRGGKAADITCTLGGSGMVAFSGVALDSETGSPLPARITIVGADPSPDRGAPGMFQDPAIFERPSGIVEILYLNAKGGIGLTDSTTLRLEPGNYLFVVTHGLEYAMQAVPVTVPDGGTITFPAITLPRVLRTPGWISADFHIHALPSPDSAMAPEQRALAAAAEGLDVLHSSDHDYLLDYGPVVASLEQRGFLVSGLMATIVGDEVSPNQLGHLHAFPLVPDPSRPNNGALDWSMAAQDTVGPDPDYIRSLNEIVDQLRHPTGGEKVIQVNHISDRATSLFLLTGLVTTATYRESHQVAPLSTYADPVGLRLPSVRAGRLPLSLDNGAIFSPAISAVELTVGPELNTNLLRESALPQWFNLLNLGLLVTATGDSDSHTPHSVPLGLPRNYIGSDIDPSDGIGTAMTELNPDTYARAINAHKVVISAGPMIQMEVRGESGAAGIGGVIRAPQSTVRIEVTAPEWAWFDTIELYANTVPTPVDDDGIGLLRGEAADPAHFHAPYHLPKYVYELRLRSGKRRGVSSAPWWRHHCAWSRTLG